MSWQSYVDTNLVGSGYVSKAAIFGLANKDLWAASPGFKVEDSEIKEIVAAHNNLEKVNSGGVHVAGIKYLTLSANERSIYAKKGSTGVCLVKTTQAVLVCTYDDKIQPGACVKVVEGLADYLISVGY